MKYSKQVYIRTFGCQMNMRDSELVMGRLMESGFEKTESADDADVILFNSCSVRKHAEDRLFSNISDLKQLKKKKPGLIIGLVGCTAQNYKERALKMAPLVDLVCGPGDEHRIGAIIADIAENRCPIVATGGVDKRAPEISAEFRESGFKAYVSIGQGCDNFCAYCIVPYVRGRERSRKASDIIREVENLAARNFKEVTLLGQNVNSYKSPEFRSGRKSGFVRLLEELNRIKGIERIRFMTSHPKDANIELFKAMAGLEKVCDHLHLPLQSGSDRILKLMNRRYTQNNYIKLIEGYRRLMPKGAVTTDIIVGFPSETDKDFNETRKLLKRIGFDSAYLFKYSPRPPARSARLKDDVPAHVKAARLEAILDMQCRISEARNRLLLGETVEVLVDGRNRKEQNLVTGRTRTNKVAVFKGSAKLIGKTVNVRVESVTPHALKGSIKK